MKLLFDEMLKSLASWSRILGIYSEFYAGKSDAELANHAKKEGLLLVTRDIRLHVRCQSLGVRSILIKSDAIEEQLAQLLGESGAAVTFPEKTRCAKCNGELQDASPESVKADVPESVLKRQGKFWRCSSCSRVYWEGGHWKNIIRIYDKAKALMASGSSTKDAAGSKA
jgi:uncharacterized protein with PIN domain